MKYILILIFGGMLLVQSCTNKPVQLFTAKEVQTSKDVTLLDIDEKQLANLRIDNSENVEIVVPFGGKTVVLELKQQELFTPDFKVMTDRGQTSFMSGIYYEGKIKGQDESLVTLNIQSNGVTGLISTSVGDINIGRQDDNYFMAKAAPESFSCLNDNNPKLDSVQRIINRLIQNRVGTLAGGNCVTVDFEFSYSTYTAFSNSVPNATNWFNSLFSAVKSIYTADGIDLKIKSLYFNTTPDGYPASPSAALTEFLNKRVNDLNFTANLMHFIRVQSGSLSGIAYVGVVCQRTHRAGLSQLGTAFNPYPQYSWPVMVVAHEIGHNVGSPHTQWCGWSGGAIDNCYTTEGGCPPGPAPVGGGTVMSYCHMTSYGINLSKGFGPQPIAKIKSTVAVCSDCVVTPPPPPPPPPPSCSDGIKNGTETGIDCGGSNCPPCPVAATCTDGIKNQNETGVDCGGVCPVCPPPSAIPISQGKPSTLFPNYSTLYPAAKGNDGIESNFFSTHADPLPWWQVDLGSNVGVSRIQIINRKDCCGDRLKNFKVYVSLDNVFSANEVVYTHTSVCTNGQVIEIPLTSKSGRYVRIEAQNSPANYLHLSEVKVFSGGVPCTPRDTIYKVIRDSVGTICR